MTVKYFLSKYNVVAFLASIIAICAPSYGCPKIGGLIDYNCDQKIKIAVTGDSIVRGIGDTTIEDEGYISRLREVFPKAEINNLGVPGITSTQLFRSFKQLLNSKNNGETKKKSKDADLFIIEVGPNDYWQEEGPALTVRNIRRLVRFLRQSVGKDLQTPPYIVIATLLPTRREYEVNFIKEVNALLLKQSSNDFPVKIRFDQLSENILSEDDLHPSPAGYDAMAVVAKRFIKGELQKFFRKQNIDTDKDGIYDRFELGRFGTDPALFDTDGDGQSDGSEVFIYQTDPLTPETNFIIPILTPTAAPPS